MAVSVNDIKNYTKTPELEEVITRALSIAKADISQYGINPDNNPTALTDSAVIQLTALYMIPRTTNTRTAGGNSITYNDFYQERNRLLNTLITPSISIV